MRHKGIAYIVAQPAVEFHRLVTKLGLSDEIAGMWDEIRQTKEIPAEWVRNAKDLTDEELRAFVIIDNNDFGEWDTEALANDWDIEDLLNWGTDIPGFKVEPEADEEPEQEKPEPEAWFINIRCEGESHAQELYEQLISKGLDVKIIN
ncbi:MAG: hypothetical protein EOP04_06980 [Proteobacteria bacterium]|nr:MAG: hypothetical protein EOP04_06980 [Pseudomonadota bacterium]